MSHRFTALFTHLIFSTKDRFPYMDKNLAPECLAYIGGIVEHMGGRRIEIGGVEDHIHLLNAMPPRSRYRILFAPSIELVEVGSRKMAEAIEIRLAAGILGV